MKVKSKGLISIIVVVVMFFILFMVMGIYAINSLRSGDSDDGFSGGGSSKSYISVVDVKGVILESREVIKLLLKAEKDEKSKAIIMRIESPGGAVGPTQEIYEEIRRIDKKKPVYASFGSIAASGGYYIGAATRKIFASPGSLTGSIGVIMQFMDLSKLYEWAMVKPTTVKGGRFKDLGNPARGLTEEEKIVMNELIDGVHHQFRMDILRVRAKKIKGDITLHTQGQIFSGSAAKKIGLVDELAGLWQAGRLIHKELELKGEFKLKFMKRKKSFSFGKILDNLDESVSQVKQQMILNQVPMLLFNP